MNYVEKQAKFLSELTEISEQEILADLENKLKEGYSEPGAVMVWKSEHKQQLGAGESRYFVGRVIGKSNVREGSYGQYGFVGFLVYDDGILEVKQATFSDSAIPKIELLKFDHVYEFKAYEKSDGTLNRIRGIKEVEDNRVPRVRELTSYDFAFPLLKDAQQLVGTTQLLHGWVGRVIKSRNTGEVIGFEFGDEETLVPITCWGQYVPDEVKEQLQEIEAGDEVFHYSYLNVDSQGNLTANINGIFKA